MEAELGTLKGRVDRMEVTLTWLQLELDHKMVLIRELFSARTDLAKSIVPYEQSICESLTSTTKVTIWPQTRTNYSPISPPTPQADGSSELPMTSTIKIPHSNVRIHPVDGMPSSSSSHTQMQSQHLGRQFIDMTPGSSEISNQAGYIARPVFQNRPQTLQIDSGISSENILPSHTRTGVEIYTTVRPSATARPEFSSHGGMVFYRDTSGAENLVKVPYTAVRDPTTPTGNNPGTSLETVKRRHSFPLQTEIPSTSSPSNSPKPSQSGINLALRGHLIQKAASASRLIQNPTSYACDICAREFVSPVILLHHKSSVHVRKQIILKPPEWKCPLCHKHFNLSYKLKHLKIHGLKRYECSVCAIQFSKENELNAHMKIHPQTEEKFPLNEDRSDTINSATINNPNQPEVVDELNPGQVEKPDSQNNLERSTTATPEESK